jgi:hypothetical protein
VARFKLHRGLTVTCSEIGNKNIPLSVVCHAEKAHAQMAHLVFAETQANAQKTKRAIFCQRTD